MSSRQAKKTKDPKPDIKNKSSQPSGKGKQTKKETEELQNEIENLKRTIVIYRNNLDPAKIRKELDLADQSMINILTDENLRLTEELQKYTSSNTIGSPSTQKATDTKKQPDVDRGDENRKDSQQKQTEMEIIRLQKENDKLKKDVLEVNEKVKKLQNEISHAKSEAEKQLNHKGQQVEQNANNNDGERSNHDEVLQQKATEIDALQEKNEELSSKLKNFEEIKTQLQNTKKSVEEKDKLIQEMIKEKTNIETEKNKLGNECESIRGQLKISEGQLEGMRKNSSNSDESTKSQADEIKQKLKEINDIKNNLTEAQRKNNDLKADKDNLDEKLRQAEKKVTSKEHEIQTLKGEHDKMLQMKDQKLRQSMEQIKAKELEIKTLKDEHGQTIKEKDETIQKLQTEKKMDQRKNSGKKNTGSNSLEEKLRSAQDEIDELKNRLSKVVGANIMNDNPNITDLSDENRPTKLSEKFSELYDNEWTDAYEEAENEFKNEEKGIAHLYKTLLDVFDFCKKKSEEHAKHIRDSVTTLPNAPKMTPKFAAIGVTNQRQLKEVRKSFAPMLIESVFQNYINEKKLNFTNKENTGKFIKKCVEICWLMNSQDPPVILDTTAVDGNSFDVDKFRTYTKTGKLVDYVVWPPMLLHKGGPMLCKGVAQGK